jgi:hypothetical protein
MGSTVTATASQVPAGTGILDIPLPGTSEYESASKLVNESFIVSMKKKKTHPKRRCVTPSGKTISPAAQGRCPPRIKKKA